MFCRSPQPRFHQLRVSATHIVTGFASHRSQFLDTAFHSPVTALSPPLRGQRSRGVTACGGRDPRRHTLRRAAGPGTLAGNLSGWNHPEGWNLPVTLPPPRRRSPPVQPCVPPLRVVRSAGPFGLRRSLRPQSLLPRPGGQWQIARSRGCRQESCDFPLSSPGGAHVHPQVDHLQLL
jgi:hypothetical protein